MIPVVTIIYIELKMALRTWILSPAPKCWEIIMPIPPVRPKHKEKNRKLSERADVFTDNNRIHHVIYLLKEITYKHGNGEADKKLKLVSRSHVSD